MVRMRVVGFIRKRARFTYCRRIVTSHIGTRPIVIILFMSPNYYVILTGAYILSLTRLKISRKIHKRVLLTHEVNQMIISNAINVPLRKKKTKTYVIIKTYCQNVL